MGSGRVVSRRHGWAFADALFSAHMVQHLLPMLVAAPLIVMGAPLLPLLWMFPRPERRRLGHATAQLYVFTMGLQSAALGALLTFAAMPWYPAYAERTTAWGFTPLQDQQLAGLIMWIPAGVVYLAASAFFFVIWLRAEEARADRVWALN